MKADLVKVEKFWVIIINHDDGTRNDYRFATKAQAKTFAKAAGLHI